MKPFILAPMAGINSTAFRLLCKENGADVIYTQMYDVDLLCTKTKAEVENLINIQEKERPVAIQLIGTDLKKIKKAVNLIEDLADTINFNAGCIEKDYLERGCGAALLKDPEKLCEIVHFMVKCTSKPVDVKIRIGWDGQSLNAVNVCKLLKKQALKEL